MLRFYKKISVVMLIYISSVSAIKTENNEIIKGFRYCLRKSEHLNIRECIGRTAISFLQRFDERDNFVFADNFLATRDETVAGRSLVNFLDTDPGDLRSVMENVGAVFSHRSLEFHMDAIYPGLMFKIGPSADSNSVAEFILDPTVNERHFNYEEPSTARILTKHYVLPFLLGLKFNLVALVPILFTVICLLLKKSLFIVKLVIYISSLLGVGGIAGALGKFSGYENFLGGYGLPPPPPGSQIGGAIGIYPGKTPGYPHYNQDEVQQVLPYKRQDRKVVFEKTEQNPSRINNNEQNNIGTAAELTSASAFADNFYEYEKQVLMQDRSGKGRTLTASLGTNTYYDDSKEVPEILNVPTNSFQTSGNSEWKVLNI